MDTPSTSTSRSDPPNGQEESTTSAVIRADSPTRTEAPAVATTTTNMSSSLRKTADAKDRTATSLKSSSQKAGQAKKAKTKGAAGKVKSASVVDGSKKVKEVDDAAASKATKHTKKCRKVVLTSKRAKAKAKGKAKGKSKQRLAETDDDSEEDDSSTKSESDSSDDDGSSDSSSDTSDSSNSSSSSDSSASSSSSDGSSSDDSSSSDSNEDSSDSDSEKDSSDSETPRQKRRRKIKKSRGKADKKDKKRVSAKSKRKDKRKGRKSSSSLDSDTDDNTTIDQNATMANSLDLASTNAAAASAQLTQMQMQTLSQQMTRIEQMLGATNALGTASAYTAAQPTLTTPAWSLPVGQSSQPQIIVSSRGARNRATKLRHQLGIEVEDRTKKKKKSKRSKKSATKKKSRKSKNKRASKLEYKRVDSLWNSGIHNYKLTDTAEDEESSEYDQYLFNVRRTFDWEGKYKATFVDIKSKLLKEALVSFMDGVKGVSLVEDTPTIDPNLLFLYLEDLRKLYKDLEHRKVKAKRGKRKARKRNETTRKHLRVLLKYLDKDFAETKKTLYPMLEGGLITFDLLWALYKPNTLAYTTTYGSVDEPRAFRIELAEKEYSFMKGEWYSIEGKYLEYDGKTWGLGTMGCDIPSFKGARKITSLECYPLKYHKNESKIRAELIERGKKFVSLQGVHYKSHKGMAYYKKRRQIVKVNINGRIMVDPAIHRRILPNYNVSTVKAKEWGSASGEDSDDEAECDCGDDESEYVVREPVRDAAYTVRSEQDEEHTFDALQEDQDRDDEPKTKLKLVLDNNQKPHVVEVELTPEGDEVVVEKLDDVPSTTAGDAAGKSAPLAVEPNAEKPLPTFTDDEYLIASPVVLGFAFAEKLWLEFTVSGIKDIVWNEGAYESLVLEDNTKEIVKALVESHKYHPAASIDDVIQGKGKGLVAVLHGPPGTGKTLTAEGISELLKCPLYMVSMGELGTDPRTLETELQKILDIAHAWGAVLLLDEADVFLEKRTLQDVHRNALVSIFLRLLEYFQGILFLTTNRVETFDDAFQSRIHVALRYGELSAKARRAVFKMFIERVRVLEGVETMPFTEEDFITLSKHALNGRQIKNTIRTAQALAVNKGEPLSMEHIRRVLDVSNAFDRDLKGGPGFEDAMRGYF